MITKRYKTRLSHIAFEYRWTFFLTSILISVLTSFMPHTLYGREVTASLSHLSFSQEATHIQQLATSKKISSTSAWFQITQLEIGEGKVIRKKVSPTPTPANEVDRTKQYGKATQIDEHTWTMTLQNDGKEGSVREIFEALNSYRTKMGISKVIWSDTLSAYAASRANEFSQKGALDGHAGFMAFMNQQDGFSKLGFNGLGENSSFGYILSGPRLIEEVYAADSEHNNNQLSSEWTHVGIGASGTATDLVFGGKKR